MRRWSSFTVWVVSSTKENTRLIAVMVSFCDDLSRMLVLWNLTVFNTSMEVFMDLIRALQLEHARLQRQLAAIQGTIAALSSSSTVAVSPGQASSLNGIKGKRTMSAAVRAKIARSARARWAKIRAQKACEVSHADRSR